MKPKCVHCHRELIRVAKEGGVVYKCIERRFKYGVSEFYAEGCEFALVVVKGGKDSDSI